MKFQKLDLLTLLISLFLLSSCKNSGDVGLELSPTESIRGELLDTATVLSATQIDDPASTYNMARYPLGELKDEIFGSTNAEVVMSVAAPGSGFTFGKNTQIDSAVLVLPYTSGTSVERYYGDTASVLNITVKQLNSNLLDQKTFLSNATYPADDVLANVNKAVQPNTRVKITNIVTGKPDTIFSANPQLRIKLSTAMIQDKILKLDSATLANDKRFKAAFKGLKVQATTTSAKGAVVFLDMTTADGASMEIYFRKQSASTTTAIDTVVSKFPVVTSATSANTNYVAASVKHNYADAVNENIASKTQTQVTYLQAGGLRNKISFPYLTQLKEKIGGSLIVSKAQLVVELSNPTDTIPFKAPLRLALYRYDLASQRQLLPDGNPGSSTNPTGDPRPLPNTFGGFYDKAKNTYTFEVTNYIQDLIDGKTVDYGTFLAATPFTEFNLFPYPTSVSRARLGSFHNTDNKRIRLNIYYIKSNP
ncbi:DUF4270 family protein [Pedobacter antarcticus]|uniref:DUF4270 family protein n=1 Tax=Pedobacter antarcticus TaxID=34086 RepID=UPI001C588E5C|nr:DUF4270 family protein [Pedobacter antarcticus]